MVQRMHVVEKWMHSSQASKELSFMIRKEYGMDENKINIRKVIQDAVNEGLKAGFKQGYKEKKTEGQNFFKQTEKLLYSYASLKIKVFQCEKDILDLEKEVYTARSKDIVRMTSRDGIRLSYDEIQQAKIEDVIRQKERSLKEIERIDRALNTIREDEYFCLIEMKYGMIIRDKTKDQLTFYEPMTVEQIAEELDKHVNTIVSNKKRLMNRLVIIFHGADALET
jgi:chaperonin cofactor prefoldin